MASAFTSWALLIQWLAACTCNPGAERGTDAPEDLLGIEGTALDEEAPDVLPPLILDEGGTPRVDVGDGVQVLQISPQGRDRRALQAAVVFDRPMVALTDLDSMNQAAPLNCSPEIPSRRRWAGTSTAVLIPEQRGAFPRSTAFRCVVPQGTAALDGTVLEKELSWTFETPRPRVVGVDPYDGADGVGLDQPVVIRFDQPVELATVREHLEVRGGRRAVSTKVAYADGTASEDKAAVEVRFRRQPDTTYKVTLGKGVTGLEGPLPSTQSWSSSFSTYPPFEVELEHPESTRNVSPSTRLRLRFTTPVAEDRVSELLRISPRPPGWDPPKGRWESTVWSYTPILAPQTRYRLSLPSSLEDVHGQRLTGTTEWTLESGDYDPWLMVPEGFKLVASNNPPELPFKHLNASRVNIALASVDPQQLDEPEGWRDLVDGIMYGDPVRRTGAGVAVPNRSQLGAVPIADLLNSEGFGWVAARYSAPNIFGWQGERQYRGLMVFTDLGGTMKVSPSRTDLWVTSLSKGEPVPGVQVELYRGTRRVGSAQTDVEGFARVSGAPSGGWSRWDHELWALLRKGTDTSIVRLDWDDGMSPYNFDIWGGFDASGRSMASHVFADRGVYRPGDKVYSRALFRFRKAEGLEIPAGKVEWTLEGPEGEALARGQGSLDSRGGFSVATALPEDGGLGDYTLRYEAKGKGWTEHASARVMARAYRAPAFRVQVSGPPRGVAGEPVEATVDARYLFGAALKKAEVRWQSWVEPASFSPDGWDGWSFGPEWRWWEEGDTWEQCQDALLGNAVVQIEDGQATFAQTVPSETCTNTVELYLEASVEDVDRQVISNRTEVLVHPGAYYVGVATPPGLAEAGEPSTLRVAAVGLDGTARSGARLDVKVLKRVYDSVRERGMDGQWRWVTTTTDETVHEARVTSGSEPVTVTYTPDKPGYYVIEVTSKDPAGRTIRGHDTTYVVGGGYVSWGRSDDHELDLVPDKARYAPGDVASILVKTPFEGMRALVTAEREGVLWRKVVTLTGTASTVQVPIDEAWRPNVFVSVVAVQGAGPQDGPDKGRPQVFMGMHEIEVDAEEEHLDVQIATDGGGVFGPREEISVSIAVQRGGEPVPGAGVTLYAVDEAVLSLTDYQTPDPHGVMYRHRPLSVLTADGRVAALDRAPFLTKGADSGGGGGEGSKSGPETRTRFLTTITWQPDLKTDASGRVRAQIKLPDNLTTFRIMAIADAGAASFGSGSKEIRVTRPLIVRPALPRHLRVGDRAFAGVVVHNDFVRDRQVQVEAEVEGPVSVEGAPVVVRVGAKESVEVPFTLEAKAPGEAKFRFSAVSGEDRDALVWSIPVGQDLMVETTATAGAVEGGTAATEVIARPDNALTGVGGLEVDLSTTALVGAGAALDYLLDYPHGCIEQKTSKALASLMALPVRERAGLSVPEEVLRSNVTGVLGELSRFRQSGGGLGYWPSSYQPSVMGTAYAVELMGRARQAGFRIDERLLAHSVDYLRAYASRRPSAVEQRQSLAEQATIAAALAHAGQGDAGLNQRVYRSRQDLSVFATAQLAQAMVRTTGVDGRSRELARAILGRATIEAGSASIKENSGGKWRRMWGSDDLSTAVALEALLLVDPDHVLAPKLALHLASSRRTGHWVNTRATAAALAALATYAGLREGKGDPIDAKVTLVGQSALQQQIPLPGQAHVDVPLVDLQNGPLEIGADGGLLYYQSRLSYAPRKPKPRDEGFTLTRAFDLPDGGASGRVRAGALVRVTLTVVTPVVRHQVAVVDRIPAGLEPLDTSFATTSQAPQAREEPSGRGTPELPAYGGSWVFDHHEIADDQVRLYADYMPPGVHTFRYVARATTPGTYDHPPATVEEMYEPENFGRTAAGRFSIGVAGGPSRP